MGFLNKRFNYVQKNTLKKIFFFKIDKFKVLRTNIYLYKKSLVMLNCFKNYEFHIHKGNMFKQMVVGKFNVGSTFGSYIFTRKPHIFIKKKKNLKIC